MSEKSATERGTLSDVRDRTDDITDIEPQPIVQLSTRPVYANRWISVREDQVRFPNAHEGIYGVVTCSPCVGILPFVDDDHVLLIRQFRYVRQELTWEMPTGAREHGEDAETAAQRELGEECGVRAGRLTPVCRFDSSKSVVHERAELFLAHDLSAVEARPEATEQIVRRVVPFAEALAMVRRSEITDAMTVIAILHAALDRAGLSAGAG